MAFSGPFKYFYLFVLCPFVILWCKDMEILEVNFSLWALFHYDADLIHYWWILSYLVQWHYGIFFEKAFSNAYCYDINMISLTDIYYLYQNLMCTYDIYHVQWHYGILGGPFQMVAVLVQTTMILTFVACSRAPMCITYSTMSNDNNGIFS